MDIDFLGMKLKSEKSDEKLFEELPYHYFEIASLLLNFAVDDIRGAQQIRKILDDLWNVRSLKIRDGLMKISGPMDFRFRNLSGLEINEMRHFFAGTLNLLRGLEENSQIQTQPVTF